MHSTIYTIPGAGMPGWRLVSPRAVHVLMTLAARARAQNTVHGTVQVSDVADWCGCTRNTVGQALGELRDLGWLATEYVRDTRGRPAGVAYRLLPPPPVLADAAVLRYGVRLARRRATQRGVRPELAAEARQVVGALDGDAADDAADAADLADDLAAARSEHEALLGEHADLTARLDSLMASVSGNNPIDGETQ